VLSGFNILEGIGIDDPKKAEWRDFIFRARARNLKGARFDFASLPRVDFTGANLEGASLYKAQLDRVSFDGAQLQDATLDNAQLQDATLDNVQLQGASLVGAQLQGATLDNAQLQGASLLGAELQGASLDGAQLQGAWLDGARLQGAWLSKAQLQGASLEGAQLQGASVIGAQLQGASLVGARLRGASFAYAQLQGASLERAALEATDLSYAYLWRTNRPIPTSSVAAIRMSGGRWMPEWIDGYGNNRRWDEEAYQALRTTIESLPMGGFRERALLRIEDVRSLDCLSSDKTLASCDLSAEPPPEAAAWRQALEAAQVDDEVYAPALAKVLRELVCSDKDEAIHVLRGVSRTHLLSGHLGWSRLEAAGPAAIDLINDLTNKDSKDCPVSTAVSDANRANLLQTKQAVEADEAKQKPLTSDAPYPP
jgi:uncharacterized protein YjbI with pentapeptide repeats